jgi:hypothetical protein
MSGTCGSLTRRPVEWTGRVCGKICRCAADGSRVQGGADPLLVGDAEIGGAVAYIRHHANRSGTQCLAITVILRCADDKQERQLIPLCVMAFQGLSSGDVNRDAQPLRFMVHEGLPLVLAQSFDAVSSGRLHRGSD